MAISTWSCENAGWTTNCVTTPDAKFDHPVTIRLLDTNGNVLVVAAQTFSMPYRPSSDLACGTRWMASDGKCYNGYAFKLDFDLSDLEVTLPDTVVYEVAYNTQHYGAAPTRVSGPYDSLNVALYDTTSVSLSAGSDATAGFIRWNGAPAADTYSPMVQIMVTAAP